MLRAQPNVALANLADKPDELRFHLLLGRILAMQEQFKDALPYLQRAVKLQPESADAHKMLGNVYAGLGEDEKARREQAEAQRLKAIAEP